MEALAALSLAGNVVQFVDIASRFVTAAYMLYDSTRGTTKENDRVELLVLNLRQLAESENLRTLAEKTQSHDARSSDQGADEPGSLSSLSKACIEVADEIIGLLDTLKIKGEHRGSQSVYRALRTVRKRDDLERLEKRLKRISDVLNNEIRRKQQDQILRQIRLLQEGNTRLQSTRGDEIIELRCFVRETFQEITTSLDEIKEGLRRDENHSALTRAHQAWLLLPFAVERERELHLEQYILQGLRYLTMDNRHLAIPTEHAKTLQ